MKMCLLDAPESAARYAVSGTINDLAAGNMKRGSICMGAPSKDPYFDTNEIRTFTLCHFLTSDDVNISSPFQPLTARSKT